MADSLSTAAQSSADSDKTAYQRLLRLEEQISRACLREAVYPALSSSAGCRSSMPMRSKGTKDVQQDPARLGSPVDQVPANLSETDDTPDAMMQAGITNEMLMKEAEAKRWYQVLILSFPDSPQRTRAKGAVVRLELEGKQMELAGPVLGTGQPFDVVQFTARWSSSTTGPAGTPSASVTSPS